MTRYSDGNKNNVEKFDKNSTDQVADLPYNQTRRSVQIGCKAKRWWEEYRENKTLAGIYEVRQ